MPRRADPFLRPLIARRARRWGACALAVALLTPVGQATARPAHAFSLGLQDALMPGDGSLLPGRLDMLAGFRPTLVRIDVVWSQISPTRPQRPRDPDDPAYRWGPYDQAIDGLAARGIEVLLDVYASPGWANGGYPAAVAPRPGPYRDFIAALARRYSGRFVDASGVRHAPVRLYEPWNEPNIPDFLRPQWRRLRGKPAAPASPTIYAGLLRRAYREIKAAQPSAKVIGVAGAPTNLDTRPTGSMAITTFIRALARPRPPMDGYSLHLFPTGAPGAATGVPSFRTIPALLRQLDRLKRGAPLYITEMGYTTAFSDQHRVFVSEAAQARDLTRAVTILARVPRVRAAVWFDMQDHPVWPGGVLRLDGTEKPSAGAFRAAAARFGAGAP